MQISSDLETVMVAGASANSSRYSHLAVTKLVSKGYKVIPVGLTKGTIAGLSIHSPAEVFSKVDTISVYLNPVNQDGLMSLIRQVNPQRVIFNPGAENPALQQQLSASGIHVEEACTLVLLSTGQF